MRTGRGEKRREGVDDSENKADRTKERERHLLRRYSPPVSVNAIFEVEHSQPPNVHIQHVVIEDIL